MSLLPVAFGAFPKGCGGLPHCIKENLSRGTLEGRSVVHWSFYVFVGSLCVGAVVLLAALILSKTPLIILGGVLTGVSGLAAYYMKKFSTLKTLLDAVNDLKRERKADERNLIEYKKQIAILEGQIEQLRSVVKDYKKSQQERKKNLGKEAKNVGRTTEELLTVEMLVKELVRKFESLSKDVGDTAEEVKIYGKKNLGLQEVSKEIQDATGRLNQGAVAIAQQNQDIKGIGKELLRLESLYSQTVSNLQKIMLWQKAFQNKFGRILRRINLSKKVLSAKEAVQNGKEAVSNLTNLVNAAEQILREDEERGSQEK